MLGHYQIFMLYHPTMFCNKILSFLLLHKTSPSHQHTFSFYKRKPVLKENLYLVNLFFPRKGFFISLVKLSFPRSIFIKLFQRFVWTTSAALCRSSYHPFNSDSAPCFYIILQPPIIKPFPFCFSSIKHPAHID